MNQKIPTIKLKGKSYVQVKDRILYFNETYPEGQITTEIITTGANMVTFKATVRPTPNRTFTGHSFGTIDEVKAFEKLETVAVGRALALMGIGVLESVASADEMQRFEAKNLAPTKQWTPPVYYETLTVANANCSYSTGPLKWTAAEQKELIKTGKYGVKTKERRGGGVAYQLANENGEWDWLKDAFVQYFLDMQKPEIQKVKEVFNTK